MSPHLAQMLAQYLRVCRKECCDLKIRKMYEQKYEDAPRLTLDWRGHELCAYAEDHQIVSKLQPMEINVDPDEQAAVTRWPQLTPVFWHKFEGFRRNQKNMRQRVRFDEISPILKRYFMEQDFDTNERKWIISFREITTIYRNVKELHFVNQYKFDNVVLEALIEQINVVNNMVEKVVFQYFDYEKMDNDGVPLESETGISFFDPRNLNGELVEKLEAKLNWNLKHCRIGDGGYKIVIRTAKQSELTRDFSDMDLTLFRHGNIECNVMENSITESCCALRRLRTALNRFRGDFGLHEETKNFVHFNDSLYRCLLDDKAHLIRHHASDLLKIRSEWIEKYGFSNCLVSECVQTRRHYSEETESETMEADEMFAKFVFYKSVYDTIHNYIFHLYDIGLRLNTSTTLNDESRTDRFIEGRIAEEQRQISSKRKQCAIHLSRFDHGSDKFMLKTTTLKEPESPQFDKMFASMQHPNIDRQKAVEFKGYLDAQQFDSDAVEVDVNAKSDSNIYLEYGESQIYAMVTAIFHERRVMTMKKNEFSTGYIFNYWTKSDEMFVQPTHENLKDEFLSHQGMGKAKWYNVIMVKVRQYMQCDEVRKIKAKRAGGPGLRFTEQNKASSLLTEKHLIALILYCDFTKLSAKFSATFRLDDPSETIESLKKRHSKFANWAKLLVESVLDFGINGIAKKSSTNVLDHERAIFYCGLNRELNIGSYVICLKGPCSTSTDRTMAVNFAQQRGILMCLSNEGYTARFQTFFDCSWLSNYPEESERLWIAGTYPLSIVFIEMARFGMEDRNVKLQKTIRALHMFDVMISDVDDGYEDVVETSSDLEIISRLFRGEEEDEYLQCDWQLFLQKKKQIKLDLRILDQSFKTLSTLIINDLMALEDDGEDLDDEEMTNLLRADWLPQFPSLQTVTIKTSGGLGESYRFRLQGLCEIMQSIPSRVVLIIDDDGQWIEDALDDDDGIYAEFEKLGWYIMHGNDDKLVIKCNGH